jgi:hypothetical protein
MQSNAVCRLYALVLAAVCTSLQAQEPTPSDVRQGDSWTRTLTERAKRGTLQDVFQNVRGDTGRWSDEPRLLHAPPIETKPAKASLDDWLDQLLEKPAHVSTAADDNWLLLRTRQLDDNDRLWVERIERRGNQFTVTLNEAIWQGKYFKTFTYYHVYGVNLGKLPPGDYEAKWVISPLTFKQFEGDGRPASFVDRRQIDNWSKDDAPAEKKPVELRTKFRVVAEAPGKE